MRTLQALLNRLPHRTALLLLLERELAGRGDFEGDVPEGVVITETVQLERPPAVRIVPL